MFANKNVGKPGGISWRKGWSASVVVWATMWAVSGAPSPEAIAKLPPPAGSRVDFKRDVQPILEAACVKCHGRGKANGGWKLDQREAFLSPGDSGPAVIQGDSARSRFIHLVAGTDPDDVMPKKGSRLTEAQVGILRAWVDQGMVWDPEVSFARPPANHLKPRKPAVPEGTAENPLDRILDEYWRTRGVSVGEAVDDRLYVRRIHLDVVGLLPTPEEWERFAQDKAPGKRAALVKRLLDDRQRYAQHWLAFWNDLLRNDYRGTGYIDGGRKAVTQWLYAALRDNKPYDVMVRELVNPTDASEGFSKGIVWRGTVNASMTPPMQAAQNIGQVFMGVNLKCASCHDSFIDDWQLSEAYGLAGIYSDAPLEMVICDKPTGRKAPLKFLFPELGSIDAGASKSNRLARLAEIITSPENGRLSRTMVNRLWAQFMGRGLVEPLDVMQNDAWNRDVLDWLAEDLVSHGWNLKRTMEMILTSRAYQLPSVDLPEKVTPDYVFRGPGIRRLSAEQFRDALGSLTGIWHEKPEGGLDRLLFEPGAGSSLPADIFWIWSQPHAAERADPGTNWFRKQIVMHGPLSEATMWVHADNSARLFINGKSVKGAESQNWDQPSIYDLRKVLNPGTNWVAMEVVNTSSDPNPAGLLIYAKIRTREGGVEKVHDFATDASWAVTTIHDPKWKETDGGTGWRSASVLGGLAAAPWKIGEQLVGMVAGKSVFGEVRASLTVADPLTRALGRPNREQVTTQRPSLATTMQALELTNGDTLAQLLRKGAEKWVQERPDGPGLVEHLFRQALSRPPSPKERELAVELVGSRPSRDGVEDFLWSLAMLPEFQLTY